MKKIFEQKNTTQGFTLLEMLFSLIIFSFALVSLMTIAGKGVVATINAKDQLTAQYLAEELLEVARNERDASFVNNWELNPFEGMLDHCRNGCDIEYSNSKVPELTLKGGGPLYQNNGYFSTDENSGMLSQFTRKLEITEVGDDNNGVHLKATVNWKQRNINREYVLETSLVNWQREYSTE